MLKHPVTNSEPLVISFDANYTDLVEQHSPVNLQHWGYKHPKPFKTAPTRGIDAKPTIPVHLAISINFKIVLKLLSTRIKA